MIWLNTFRYFYLLGAVNALFFSILIFSKQKRGIADRILGVWLIVLSLQLIAPFIFLSNLDFYYKVTGAEFILLPLHPLFLYYYIRAITGSNPVLHKSVIFIGLSLIFTSYMSLLFLVPAKIRYNIILGTHALPTYTILFIIPLVLFFLFFWLNSSKILRNYKMNILQVYSYKQNVDLLWLRRIFVLFYSLLIFTGVVGIVFHIYELSLVLSDYFYFAGLTFFIFLLGFWGYKQGKIFSFQIIQDELEIKHKKHISDTLYQPKKFDAKASELKAIMEKQKPFLNPTLTIYELASMIDIPPHQLSRLINKKFNCNFFELVNYYRIDAFKKLMLSDKFKNFTILAVAFECGFNSKSAFNRIFKDQTGLTPKEFINQHSFN